jgi:prolyl-tRNA synthetase
MFADWELIGVPLRVTVGERSLKEGNFELQARHAGASAQSVARSETVSAVRVQLAQLANA